MFCVYKNKAIDIEVPEEDKSVACVSLDLPEFTRHTSTQHFPEASPLQMTTLPLM